MTRETAKGDAPTMPEDAPVPTDRKLADGQYADHWVMPAGERAGKPYARPVRYTYVHVGPPGPKFEVRELTEKQRRLFVHQSDEHPYVKFEPYPTGYKGSSTGRFWTQQQLDKVGKGCGVQTRMPPLCAETYAKDPGYYGSTFCCGCNEYLPVGADGEFVWDDGSGERVGT